MRKTTVLVGALAITIATATPIAIQKEIEKEQKKATLLQKKQNKELAMKVA